MAFTSNIRKYKANASGVPTWVAQPQLVSEHFQPVIIDTIKRIDEMMTTDNEHFWYGDTTSLWDRVVYLQGHLPSLPSVTFTVYEFKKQLAETVILPHMLPSLDKHIRDFFGGWVAGSNTFVQPHMHKLCVRFVLAWVLHHHEENFVQPHGRPYRDFPASTESKLRAPSPDKVSNQGKRKKAIKKIGAWYSKTCANISAGYFACVRHTTGRPGPSIGETENYATSQKPLVRHVPMQKEQEYAEDLFGIHLTAVDSLTLYRERIPHYIPASVTTYSFPAKDSFDLPWYKALPKCQPGPNGDDTDGWSFLSDPADSSAVPESHHDSSVYSEFDDDDNANAVATTRAPVTSASKPKTERRPLKKLSEWYSHRFGTSYAYARHQDRIGHATGLNF
ncbi:hypothetical protein F5Y19DRAFT_67911 [Xylariaceae sp. FL1651]|nr:hypothetical protein F5Y19DRAFT_67911 [Xylariaceae sp. FL1651]